MYYMINPTQLDDEINDKPVDQVIQDVSGEDSSSPDTVSLQDSTDNLESSPDADSVSPENEVHQGVDEGTE